MVDEAVVPAPLGAALDSVELDSSRRLAGAALLEVTPASQFGELVAVVPETDAGVYTLQYASLLPGYPDWRWNVSFVRLVDQPEPTVLEVELLPGDGALLAPSWVPWSERLAEYEAAQLQEAAEQGEDDPAHPEASDDEPTSKSSKRIRRTRTRRRIVVDGAGEDALDAVPTEAEAAGTTPSAFIEAAELAPLRSDVDEQTPDDGKRKKKRKKGKQSKSSEPSARATTSDDAVGDEAPEPDEKSKKGRRKRAKQTPTETVDAVVETDAAAAEASAAAAQPAKRKRKKKQLSAVEAAAEPAEATISEPAVAPGAGTDADAGAKAPAKRRRAPKRAVAEPVAAAEEATPVDQEPTAPVKRRRRRVVVDAPANDEGNE